MLCLFGLVCPNVTNICQKPTVWMQALFICIDDIIYLTVRLSKLPERPVTLLSYSESGPDFDSIFWIIISLFHMNCNPCEVTKVSTMLIDFTVNIACQGIADLCQWYNPLHITGNCPIWQRNNENPISMYRLHPWPLGLQIQMQQNILQSSTEIVIAGARSTGYGVYSSIQYCNVKPHWPFDKSQLHVEMRRNNVSIWTLRQLKNCMAWLFLQKLFRWDLQTPHMYCKKNAALGTISIMVRDFLSKTAKKESLPSHTNQGMPPRQVCSQQDKMALGKFHRTLTRNYMYTGRLVKVCESWQCSIEVFS